MNKKLVSILLAAMLSAEPCSMVYAEDFAENISVENDVEVTEEAEQEIQVSEENAEQVLTAEEENSEKEISDIDNVDGGGEDNINDTVTMDSEENDVEEISKEVEDISDDTDDNSENEIFFENADLVEITSYADDDYKIEILQAPYKTEYMYGIEARKASDFDLRGLKIRSIEAGKAEDITVTKVDENYFTDSNGYGYTCSIWDGDTELEWNENEESNAPLAVGEYTLQVEGPYNTASVKLTIVSVKSTLPTLEASGTGKYSGNIQVFGKYACAQFTPDKSGTYNFTANARDFDWGNGYSFELYDSRYSSVPRINSNLGMSKYKLKQGAVYYLAYRIDDYNNFTSINYQVEYVQRITSIKIIEKPYSKNYYIYGNTGIPWEAGKFRLYGKYGGKVKVTYSNGETETVPAYADNKYGQTLILYIKYSGKGGYGTYDLYFKYEDSEVETKIIKGAVIKKISQIPILKGRGAITTFISKEGEEASSDSFCFVTGSATRYEITANPLSNMTFAYVYDAKEGKTKWAGSLSGGKGIRVFKPNSVYHIQAQGTCITANKQKFTIKPVSGKISNCKVNLSKTNIFYTGKILKPTVTVIDSGFDLTEGIDYTLAYSNNKNPGTASVMVKGKGSYTGTIKKTFKIKVSGCTLKSVRKSGASNVQINWTKATGVSGYYVYRASSKNGKFSKIATITNAKTVKYTDKKATSGRTWYYKIISYAKISGKAVPGASSKTLYIKLKK